MEIDIHNDNLFDAHFADTNDNEFDTNYSVSGNCYEWVTHHPREDEDQLPKGNY